MRGEKKEGKGGKRRGEDRKGQERGGEGEGEAKGGEGKRGEKILRLHDISIRTFLMATNQNPTKVGLGKQQNKIKGNELIHMTEK